jgi:hypothetical protein
MVTVRPSLCYLLACDWKARPSLREVARVRARTVLPPGLGAGTAYRGAGSDSHTGGANPACAAGGARRAGSGDCALACDVARAAMLLLGMMIVVASLRLSGFFAVRELP